MRAPVELHAENIMSSFSKSCGFSLLFCSLVILPVRAQSLSQVSAIVFDDNSAAANAPTDPLGRTTPSGSVLGFLQAAQSGDYSIAAQYLQMSAARRQAEGEQLATQAQGCDGQLAPSPGAFEKLHPARRNSAGRRSARPAEARHHVVGRR